MSTLQKRKKQPGFTFLPKNNFQQLFVTVETLKLSVMYTVYIFHQGNNSVQVCSR